jgi:hypothetical protein
MFLVLFTISYSASFNLIQVINPYSTSFKLIHPLLTSYKHIQTIHQINKSFSALCYSVSGQKCIMNNTVTNNSEPKGCFWNPVDEQFSCVVSYDGSSKTSYTSECMNYCPKACPENYWKCNDLCIPVSQPCSGNCMTYYTFNCNDSCIPANIPCNGICHFGNQVNCQGGCLDIKTESELIVQKGCEGKCIIYDVLYQNY